jgi:hypothetical protein
MSLLLRLRNLGQTTTEIHREELQRFLATHPEATALSDAPAQEPVVVVGEICSLRIVPRSGGGHLDVTIKDGTGTAVVRFLGRRAVPGLATGRRLRVYGRSMRDPLGGDHLRFTNPHYELL